jgi:hypothetical protein
MTKNSNSNGAPTSASPPSTCGSAFDEPGEVSDGEQWQFGRDVVLGRRRGEDVAWRDRQLLLERRNGSWREHW